MSTKSVNKSIDINSIDINKITSSDVDKIKYEFKIMEITIKWFENVITTSQYRKQIVNYKYRGNRTDYPQIYNFNPAQKKDKKEEQDGYCFYCVKFEPHIGQAAHTCPAAKHFGSNDYKNLKYICPGCHRIISELERVYRRLLTILFNPDKERKMPLTEIYSPTQQSQIESTCYSSNANHQQSSSSQNNMNNNEIGNF
eukprot:150783_1